MSRAGTRSTPRTAAAPRKSRSKEAEIVAADEGSAIPNAPDQLSPVASAKLRQDDAAGKARGHDARRFPGLLDCAHHAGGRQAIAETIGGRSWG